MNKVLVMALCAFGLAFSTPTYAQPAGDPPAAADSLRETANEAANAANAEDAASDDIANAAEVATTVATGGGLVEAPAAENAEPGADEIIGWFQSMIEAGKMGAYGPMFGFGLMFLVWLLRFRVPVWGKSILSFIPNSALPWVTLGIACVGTLGTELAVGSGQVGPALISAFITGGSAIAMWEALGKHFLPKPKEDAA